MNSSYLQGHVTSVPMLDLVGFLKRKIISKEVRDQCGEGDGERTGGVRPQMFVI